MKKKLSWVVTIQFDGLEPFLVGNFITEKFDHAQVRMDARHWAMSFLPVGFKILAIQRGRVDFKAEGPLIEFLDDEWQSTDAV